MKGWLHAAIRPRRSSHLASDSRFAKLRVRPTACAKLRRAPIKVKTSRFFACSRDSADDGTIDALSLPERDLTHPGRLGNNLAAPTAYAEVVPANTVAPSLLVIRGGVGPFVAEAAPHKDQMNCRAGHLYSQHDIVCDPQACIICHLTIGGGVAP